MKNLLPLIFSLLMTSTVFSMDDLSTENYKPGSANFPHFARNHYRGLAPLEQFKEAIKLGDYRMFRSLAKKHDCTILANVGYTSGDYPIHLFLDQMRQGKYRAKSEHLAGVMSIGTTLIKCTNSEILQKEDRYGVTPCAALSRIIPTKAHYGQLSYHFFPASKELNDRLHTRLLD